MNRILVKKIWEMAKLDQAIRKGGTISSYAKPNWKDKGLITKGNTKILKKIVKQFGWPTIQLVGKKASNLAWLLVQHADHDLKFQRYCLRLMIKEAKRGNVLWENVAYLTDRILVNDGRPQLYGTQFYESKAKLIPRLIKNVDELDERRKEMGLEPFEDYEKKILKNYLRRQ